jgi:hypothetical protein
MMEMRRRRMDEINPEEVADEIIKNLKLSLKKITSEFVDDLSSKYPDLPADDAMELLNMMTAAERAADDIKPTIVKCAKENIEQARELEKIVGVEEEYDKNS